MKIQEKFVTFEQAKKLREIGFDEPCIARYSKSGQFQMNTLTEWYKFNSGEIKGSYISAPLLFDAYLWLLEITKEDEEDISKDDYFNDMLRNIDYFIQLRQLGWK